MNKFLKVFGLQKIPKEPKAKTLQQIKDEEIEFQKKYCEHEWVEILRFQGEVTLYCPKCDTRTDKFPYGAEILIKSSQLRKKYLESQTIDAPDERIKQIELEMKKNDNG